MITIKNEDKSFGKQVLFQHCTLQLSKGCYSLEGKNGVGKSTLLRLLVGLEKFDSGHRCKIKGSILYLDMNFLGVVPFTIRENIEILWKTFHIFPTQQEIEKVEAFYGDRLDVAYASASTGMKSKLGLSLLFVKDWDYIFIDETISTIDKESLEMIFNRLKEMAKTSLIIYVSHGLTHKTPDFSKRIVIENGGINVFN